MPLRPSRLAAILALVCTGVVRDAAAEQTLCYTIQPGDTAAYMALRFTGSVQHRYEPWFQIVDPSSPEAHPEGGIRPDTSGLAHVCPGNAAHRRVAPWDRNPRLHLAGRQRPLSPSRVTLSILVGSGAALLALVLIAWRATSAHVKRKRATTRVMQSFAERFISEFERPLRQPGSAERPLQARMRFVLRRRRVDILLAPNGGRSYPNLTDHRGNVTYDVMRVVRLIADTRFTTGDVYARGRWVVVPCRLATEPRQEGGR